MGVSGPLKSSTFLLEQERFSIGRDPSNQLVISDSRVARRHCILEKKLDGFVVRDLGSRTGTTVNGKTAVQTPLQHGDRIEIADTAFVFLAQPQQQADAQAVQPIESCDHALASGDTGQVFAGEAFDPGKMLDATSASDQLARDLGALLRIATRISSIHSVESLQWQLLGMIFEIIPADRGAILLDGACEDFSGSVAWDRTAGPAETVNVCPTVVQRVMQEKTGLLIEDVAAAPDLQGSQSLAEGNVQSLLCVPMSASDRVIGVIYLDSTRSLSRFSSLHLQLMTAIAGIAALGFENARQLESLRSENRRLRTEMEIEHDMVGDHPAVLDVLQKIARLARSDATILIYGESGTGKELAAHALHRNSPRAEKAFVAINCAALTETLLESELFGHEKGAFTGAVGSKPGQIEIADGGTLFLDEIGEMSPTLQAKLLRVLQQREFFRVGGTRPIHVDIRLVAATNKDLAAEVAAGRFRQDLYYRLNVVSFTMPPLRDRKSDLPRLAQHFVERYSRKCKRVVKGISAEALACMADYHWPGNVRELENAMERAIVLGSSEWVLPEDLPETVLEAKSGATAGSRYHDAVLAVKKDLITKAVEQANGNYTEAARLLDLHPNYLHRLMRNMDLKSRSKSE